MPGAPTRIVLFFKVNSGGAIIILRFTKCATPVPAGVTRTDGIFPHSFLSFLIFKQVCPELCLDFSKKKQLHPEPVSALQRLTGPVAPRQAFGSSAPSLTTLSQVSSFNQTPPREREREKKTPQSPQKRIHDRWNLQGYPFLQIQQPPNNTGC